MPANNDFPILDGIAPSWADIIVKATPYEGALLEMKDIAAINSASSVEVGEQRGGGRVMRRTTGDLSDEASWTLYRTGYQALIRNLASVAPTRGAQKLISLVHFDIQVQHTPPGSVEIYEYHIRGCRITGRTLNGAEGTDADQVEVPLSALQIVDIVDGEEVVLL